MDLPALVALAMDGHTPPPLIPTPPALSTLAPPSSTPPELPKPPRTSLAKMVKRPAPTPDRLWTTHRPAPTAPARTLVPVNPWPAAGANMADSSAHLAALQAAFYSAKTAEESLGYLQAMSDWKEFSLQLTAGDIQED